MIKDLREFNKKQPSVHLQENGAIKIVYQLVGTENIGGFSLTSSDDNGAYMAEIDADGNLKKVEAFLADARLIFAPDNSYYYFNSLPGHEDTVLSKFSSDHQLEWRKTSDTLSLGSREVSIVYNPGNLAPFAQSDNSLIFEQYGSGNHLRRISSEGNLEWTKELDFRINSISPSNDGGAIYLQTDYSSDPNKESLVK